MNHLYDNMNAFPSPDMDHDRFFEKVTVPYPITREEAWEVLEAKLQPGTKAKTLKLRSFRVILAAAAVIVLLLGVLAVMRFYTVSVKSEPGMHLACSLPDGSAIELNAASKISYHPMWWKIYPGWTPP